MDNADHADCISVVPSGRAACCAVGPRLEDAGREESRELLRY